MQGCTRLPGPVVRQLGAGCLRGGGADATAAGGLSDATDDFAPAGFQILMADEFSGQSLDRSKWCTRLPWGGGDTPQVQDDACLGLDSAGTLDFLTDEQQRYRDFNTAGEPLHVVSGGTLSLVATRTRNDAYAAYESAMIRSKVEFQPTAATSYYVTARVKLPNVRGTWPAMWIVDGLTQTNGDLPEIDILEAPTNGLDITAETIRQGAQVSGVQTSSGSHEFTFSVSEFDTDLQAYVPARSLRDTWVEIGALWTVDSVCYFVDGLKTACENYRWVTSDGVAAPNGHLILNMAIGGAWAGAGGIEDDKMPVRMEIDHVRVYRSR